MIQIHWIAAACLFAQTTTPLPKPAPFPTSTPPSTAKPAPQTQKTPGAPAVPQDGGTIDPHLAGVPIYPGAELLSSFDAGRGQWVFTFGSDMPFSDISAYYILGYSSTNPALDGRYRRMFDLLARPFSVIEGEEEVEHDVLA